MFCEQCGQKLKPAAKFCQKCGAVLSAFSLKEKTQEGGKTKPHSPIIVETNDQRFTRIFGEGVLIPLILSAILAGIGYKVYGTHAAVAAGATVGFFLPMLDGKIRKAFSEVMLYVILVVGGIGLIIWLFFSDFLQN